jgi:hypothetical protein
MNIDGFEWHDASKDLPEDGVDVLVCGGDFSRYEVLVRSDQHWTKPEEGDQWNGYEPLFWTFIPKPKGLQ